MEKNTILEDNYINTLKYISQWDYNYGSLRNREPFILRNAELKKVIKISARCMALLGLRKSISWQL